MDEIRAYFDERIIALEAARSTIGNFSADVLIDYLYQLKTGLDDYENYKAPSIKETKKALKDTMVEQMHLENVKDPKERIELICLIHDITDFKYDNPNSLESILDISNDMKMSVEEYLSFAIKIAIDLLSNEEDDDLKL